MGLNQRAEGPEQRKDEGAPYTVFFSDGVTIECETIEEVVDSILGRLFFGAIPYNP